MKVFLPKQVPMCEILEAIEIYSVLMPGKGELEDWIPHRPSLQLNDLLNQGHVL